MISTACLETANASKYLQQLCKHFAHKVEVRFDETEGHCALPPGPALLRADADGLTVQVEAEDAKGLIQARFVIDSHLVTFAFREGFTGLDWSRP
ncbi:DUF2218 domain-containing protein [Cereibacter sphaeroides]|uniref:DUF2218 domain-containing protein n=1 Tax=Cereibacter sphaeroides TaxID=1063 RepID=UPI000F5385B1|nr:DUF2218 domain-containing protein [Cereibacter sphaeroides]AZB56982.1 DUF2218 domain-containing protein [Cereibacter sphaeroides]AZB61232.1 DUF2218 domain-containing protein [Cereibacter sphaeroides]